MVMIGLREYAVFGIVNFCVGSLVGAFFFYKILGRKFGVDFLKKGKRVWVPRGYFTVSKIKDDDIQMLVLEEEE